MPSIGFSWNEDGKENHDDDSAYPKDMVGNCLLIPKQGYRGENRGENGIDAVSAEVCNINGEDFEIEKNH